jgi:xanthine dehydrogenase large subunit
MNDATETGSSVGTAALHESAHLHVGGEARYTDDIPVPDGTLYAAIGYSARAHARIRRIDFDRVVAASGVIAVLTAADIPGDNNYGPVVCDDPIFATELVEYVGQPLFAVLATTVESARRAAKLASVDYTDLESVPDIDSALEKRSFILPTRKLVRGEPVTRIESARHRLSGGLSIGGQDHFYLEGQVAFAEPGEDNTMVVHSSTQHVSDVQRLVARALRLQAKDILVQCRRMGGGFGGKETQPALIACIAALGARKTGLPVRLSLSRDDDMHITGKRHPFQVSYEVGFDDDGRIRGARLTLASNCGRSADLSDAVNARAMLHVDNCYFLSDVEIVSYRCKTNTQSHTAFRGFGGPQGMLLIECVIDDIAMYLGKDALEVRRINFYGQDDRNVTPYGMTVEDNVIERLVGELESTADYGERRKAIAEFNVRNDILKRGMALTPVKFGIAFAQTHLNQAGALIHVYTDGTILLNHGGTEMGQGLHTKIAQVVAEEFQVGLDQVRCTATDTSKVPNTSATAASTGSDLNGKAAQAAAVAIRDRLIAFAAKKYGVDPGGVVFHDGAITIGSKLRMSFAELVTEAYIGRVSLSATGFYRTPKIHLDPETLTGRPFFYFAYGAAVAEVVIDTLTGESRLLRVDILHDVGESLNPAIDLGQVEGGFLQGVGWLTSEELRWRDDGMLMTHSPSTYKIPTSYDWPDKFNINLVHWGRNNEETIYRSKAVGEPPLMLSMSVFHAIRNAIAATGGHQQVQLDAPATPERIFSTLRALAPDDPHQEAEVMESDSTK